MYIGKEERLYKLNEQPALVNVLKSLGYSSFEDLLDKYQHKVFSTVYSFTQNRADAEDLSQEVFFLIYKNIATFKNDSSLSTWIYRITVNRCIMEKRTQSRRKNIAKFVPFKQDISQANEPKAPPVERQVIQDEDKDTLYKAINSLSERYAMVITLRYMQDLSVKEIGQVLQLPPRTVETRLYRAKIKLKEELKNNGYERKELVYGL